MPASARCLASGRAALADAPKDIDDFSSFGERRSDRSRVADAHFVADWPARPGIHSRRAGGLRAPLRRARITSAPRWRSAALATGTP